MTEHDPSQFRSLNVYFSITSERISMKFEIDNNYTYLLSL